MLRKFVMHFLHEYDTTLFAMHRFRFLLILHIRE